MTLAIQTDRRWCSVRSGAVAVTATIYSSAVVMAAPAAAPRSLSRQICDIKILFSSSVGWTGNVAWVFRWHTSSLRVRGSSGGCLFGRVRGSSGGALLLSGYVGLPQAVSLAGYVGLSPALSLGSRLV
jgi:hypothetical protein